MLYHMPTNLVALPNSTEIIVESDDDVQEDDNLRLFDSFQEFMQKCVQDQLNLGDKMDFKELLLPNWCRIHDASHSEFDCCLFQMAIGQIKIWFTLVGVQVEKSLDHNKEESKQQDGTELGSLPRGEVFYKFQE